MINKYSQTRLYLRIKHQFKTFLLPFQLTKLYYMQLFPSKIIKKNRNEWREWRNWFLNFHSDLKEVRPSLFSAKIKIEELHRQSKPHRPSSTNGYKNVDHFWNNHLKIRLTVLDKLHESNELSRKSVGFIGSEITNSIGHIAEGLSNRAKARELGFSKKTYIVLSSKIINRHYLENYWSNFFPVVSVSPFTEASLELEHQELFETINYFEIDGEVKDNDVGHDFIETVWEQQNRGPLLRSTEADSKEAAAFLNKFGFEDGDKYVVLHLRTTPDDSARNVDIQSYLLTINYLCEIGYWVVRIGSSDTPRVNIKSARFIDYANSGFRSEVLDIALIANANLMIGCSSGPLWVANSFGVPLVWTNCTGLVRSQYFSNAILLPKILRYENSGQVVPLLEESNLSMYEVDEPNHHDNFYYQNNDEIEILETVKEFVNSTIVTRKNNEIDLLTKTLEEHKGSKMTKLSSHFIDTYTESILKLPQTPRS